MGLSQGQPSRTPDLRHEDDSSKQEVSVTPLQACRSWEAEAEDCNFKARLSETVLR